jgi:hypothetical protein
MKIKKYNDFIINEKVIQPYDFKEFIKKFDNNRRNISGLEDLNSFSEHYNIKFVNFDYFYKSLGEDIEKQLAPKDLLLMGGVKFALFNKYENNIMIVVEEELFLKYITNDSNIDDFLMFIEEVLRHESIHLQQVDRMKDKSKFLLDSSPTHNSEKYWKEKRELMAYAQTFIDHLVQQKLSKQEIKDKLTYQKDIKSWVFNIYKKVLDEKEMKRFMKYVYEYYEHL